MSQAGSIVGAGGGGTPITTLNGDTGSATGSTILLYANNAARNAGATVRFVNIGTTSTFNVTTPILLNTFIGANAGTTTVSGTENTAVGSTALTAITSGTFNTAFGSRCLQSMQGGVSNTAMGLACMRDNVGGQDNAAFGDQSMTFNTGNFNACLGAKSLNGSGAGSFNVCIGHAAGTRVTSGEKNCLIGRQAGDNITTGSSNITSGYQSLFSLVSGNHNISFGDTSGFAYTTNESSNILLHNNGVVAESNTIRIGTQGTGAKQQNRCFVAGIASVAVSNQQTVAINSSTGQLGAYTGNPRVVINCGDIDYVAGGIVDLFTPASDFILTEIFYKTTATSGAGLPAQGSLGTNAATYDNVVNTIQFTQIQTVLGGIGADDYNAALSPTFAVGAGLLLKMNISTPSGSTTLTAQTYISGFYI